MKKILLLSIFIFILLLSFIFISNKEYNLAEEKAEKICEKIKLGDSYDDVLKIMTDSLSGEENAELSKYKNYKFITNEYYVYSINQRYICTVEFDDLKVIDKFVNFLD